MDKYILTYIGSAALLILVVVLIAVSLSKISCSATWRDSNMESRWSVMTGCQVKYDGNWIPADSFRVGVN